jgi:hypothetical protein
MLERCVKVISYHHDIGAEFSTIRKTTDITVLAHPLDSFLQTIPIAVLNLGFAGTKERDV